VVGVVAYCMGSPFRRVPRVEYVYGGVSVQALDPVAPLVEGEVYDNVGVVFVPDIYSVWPDVGLFPRVSGYDEVLGGLEEFMARKCGVRLSPGMCGRVRFRVVPWSGVMGAWRFTGLLGDATLFMVHGLLEVLEGVPRVSSVYALMGEDTHPALGMGVVWASMAVSSLYNAVFRLVYAEPRPYPAEKGAESILYDAAALDATGAAVRLSWEARLPARARLLEPRTPKAARRLGGGGVFSGEYADAVRLTLASLAFFRRGMLLPLVYQACGARDPLGKVRGVVSQAVDAYVGMSELHKKIVGGNLVHHLTVNLDVLLGFLAGASLEAVVLKLLGERGVSCEELYGKGVPSGLLGELASRLQLPGDSTPEECVEAVDERARLREGCLSRLRRTVLREAQG
jgi:hypothetical protein